MATTNSGGGWGAADWAQAALLAWQAYNANQNDDDPKVTEAPMAPHQIYAAQQLMDQTRPGGNPFMNYLGPIGHSIMQSHGGLQWNQPQTIAVPGVAGSGGQRPFSGAGPMQGINWDQIMQPWVAQSGQGARPLPNNGGVPNYGQGGRPTPNPPGQGPNIGATPLGDPRNYGMDLPTGVRHPRNDDMPTSTMIPYPRMPETRPGYNTSVGTPGWATGEGGDSANWAGNPNNNIPGGQGIGAIYDALGNSGAPPEQVGVAQNILSNQGFQNALATGGWAAATAWATAQFGPLGTLGIKLIQTIVRGVRGGRPGAGGQP